MLYPMDAVMYVTEENLAIYQKEDENIICIVQNMKQVYKSTLQAWTLHTYSNVIVCTHIM